MKKILRSGISILTAIFIFSLCGFSDIYVSATTAKSPPKTTSVVSNSSESTSPWSVKPKTKTSKKKKTDPPVRLQNGIEICIEDSDFKISEKSIKKLDSVYKSYPGTNVAWGIYSLKDNSYIAFNKDDEFTSCSTIKVVYSLYCLEQVKLGKASLDSTLEYDKSKHHYNSKTASSSTIAKMGRSEFTLKEVIYYALYVSDNDAYMMLLYYFGYDGFNEYVESLGSTTSLSSSFKYGRATVSNRALEWKKIYSFYNEDDKTSKFLKNTLLDAKYGYIEEGLEDLGYNTAHKSGWSNSYGAAHDCAVVYSPNGEYLMIILTQKYDASPKKNLVKALAPILNEIWESTN